MTKNPLIVYYSFYGNTEVVAKEIQKQTGADLIRIEEVKPRKKGAMIGPAFAALMGCKSAIKPLDFSMADHDTLFLGLQVWARRTTPAINRFISKATFQGKKVYLFITNAEQIKPENIIASVTRRITKKGGTVVDVFAHRSPWLPNNDRVIPADEIIKPVSTWLAQAGLIDDAQST